MSQDTSGAPSERGLITGMGAALVDLFAAVSEEQLAALGSPKASMSLIDAAQSSALQEKVAVNTRQPGGSIANSIAGMAALGMATGFIGKIGDDDLGRVFAAAFTKARVRFPTTPMATAPTGHCLVLVTPDAERTMHTVLGASVTTGMADLDTALLADTRLLFGEGYLWDSPSARAAFMAAAENVRGQGGKLAFSLADGLCVARHHAAFMALLDEIDILLANEAEIKALLGTDSPDDIAEKLAAYDILAAVTYGAGGVHLCHKTARAHVPAQHLTADDIVDLTGAGDQFAAGFLAGLHQSKTMEAAATMGVEAASAVIRHIGPRPPLD
jgi:sugar/nucleoside kinase (ribokinase family)